MIRFFTRFSALYVAFSFAAAPLYAAKTEPSAEPTRVLTGWDKIVASWKEPVPPRHLVGNIYYVGAAGVSSFLITTSEGHILLDTGFSETVPIIQRGVAELGFKHSDIKIILSSHAHFDHVQGHAEMKRLTGARVYASAADAKLLASGGKGDVVPLPEYEPLKADVVLADGDTVSLGGVTLTALVTPGHTAGATTWTMDVEDHGKTYRVVFFSSASINPGTRLINNPVYPQISDDLESTFARMKSLPCDIFFAPHGSQFGMDAKFARLDAHRTDSKNPHPLVDPEGFRTLIAQSEKAYLQALAEEKSSRK